ncbi:MAG: radical SAM protein [Patescibacteria group bacterium]
MKKIIPKIKRLILYLKTKGFKGTYNYLYYYILWTKKWAQKLFLPFIKYPPFLEIEVTTRCNLRCVMCEHTYWHEPIRDMTFEEFRAIIDQFPRLKWIGLTGIGESFLNQDFLKMLEYVKTKSIYVELYDNFIFITPEISKKLIKIGVDRIIASFDAAVKETYEKIRVGAKFESVISNLKNFIKLKKELNSHFPEIDFHFIVSRLNIQEIPDYVNLVHSLDTVGSKVVFTRVLHWFREIEHLCIDYIPSEIIQKTEKGAQDLGLRIGWGADVPKEKPLIRECKEYIMPFIFATGHVICCCATNEANRRDFQKETSFGNVFERPFREIWDSEKYKMFRQMIRQGQAPLQCQNCPIYKIK